MVYAKQIAPEYQESPLFIDGCFPDNIILTGNRDYNSHTTPEYDKIAADFDSMAETWENERFFFQWNGAGYDKIAKKPEYTLAELLREYGFERPDGKPWTTKQRHAWRELLEGEDGAEEDNIIIAALELLTGKAWKAFIISGCCQSDWQAGFCPVEEWSREALEVFETEYFNTGSEWIIHDEDGEPESPEEVTGYSVYCVGWNDEQIKRELADAAGESDPAAVVLFKFTGWSRCPEYERAV
jgi:hypothetical protein